MRSFFAGGAGGKGGKSGEVIWNVIWSTCLRFRRISMSASFHPLGLLQSINQKSQLLSTLGFRWESSLGTLKVQSLSSISEFSRTGSEPFLRMVNCISLFVGCDLKHLLCKAMRPQGNSQYRGAGCRKKNCASLGIYIYIYIHVLFHI